MIFYLVILSFFILFFIIQYFLNVKLKRIFSVFLIGLLFLIAGTRFELGGSDYSVYKSFYDSLPILQSNNFSNLFFNPQSVIYQYEIGYSLLNIIVKSIGFNFYGFTIIHSFIFFSLFYLSLRKFTHFLPIILLVFLYKLFFYNTFISLRQSLTIVLFLFSIKFIINRNVFKYYLFIFLMITLHNAAVILIPVYFLNKIRFSLNFLLVLTITLLPFSFFPFIINQVILFFLNNFVFSLISNSITFRINQYLTPPFSSALDIFHTIEFLIVMILLLANFKYLNDKLAKYNNLYFSFMILLLIIFTFFRGIDILTRIKDYFILVYAIFLGLLMNKNPIYRLTIGTGVITIVTFGFIRYILLFDNGALMPYESFLFKEGISIFW
jgi:hypothetical protein